MIATPTYGWSVDVRYVDALMQTARLAGEAGVVIAPVFIPGDALVQRARNSLVKIAVESGVDDIVFIDADIAWQPEDFFRLLGHDVDVVGGLYRQKADDVVLVFRPNGKVEPDARGLLEVAAVGCGLLRVRGSALRQMWEASAPYRDGPVESRNLFEVVLEDGELVSEDVAFCHKWRAVGGQVHVDVRVVCSHFGQKNYGLALPPAPEKPQLVAAAKPKKRSGKR